MKDEGKRKEIKKPLSPFSLSSFILHPFNPPFILFSSFVLHPFNLFFILPFFSGCMVGPNYKKPEVAMPEKFVEETKTEAIASESDLCHWWKQLGDPCLDALLEEALRMNFDFRIAAEKICQARAQFRIERSRLWPEIDFNATTTRSLFSPDFFNTAVFDSSSGTTTNGSPFRNLFQVGLDAIWELDFWGKFRRSKNAAYDLWEMTVEEAQSVLISVLSEVAVDYINIRALQQQIDLLHKKIDIDKEELSLATYLFEAGLDSQLEVTRLLSVLEADSAQLPSLEISLKQTIYALAYLLARKPESLIAELRELKPIPNGVALVPVGLPSDLLRRRPDVRQAERSLAAATEQIGVAVADLFPHISLTGSTIAGGAELGSGYGFQSQHLNNLLNSRSRTWSVGVNILWNLIDFGKVRATIAVQTSLQKQALLAYEQTVTASLKEVEGALVAYFNEQKRNCFLDEKLIADFRSLELTEDLYQAGLANESEVLEARKAALESESLLIGSDQAVTGDLIALYKALGGNWECTSSP